MIAFIAHIYAFVIWRQNEKKRKRKKKKRTTMPNMTLFITMRHTHCQYEYGSFWSQRFFSSIFGNSCDSCQKNRKKLQSLFTFNKGKSRLLCGLWTQWFVCMCQIALIFVLLQDMPCTWNNEQWHRLVSAYWMTRKPYLAGNIHFHDDSIFFNRGNYKRNEKHAAIVDNFICERDERILPRRALDECAI